MNRPTPARRAGLLALLLIALGVGCFAPAAPPAALARALAPALAAATPLHRVYVPVFTRNSPWKAPFGVQAERPLTLGSPILTRTAELGAGWARMGPISWRLMQPTEGGPINWDVLAQLETELRAVRQFGITPEVVIYDSPAWATINKPFATSCGAIRPEKYGAYAAFISALIERYGTPEFNVHHWELGNEIDIDPRLVQPNNGFGCWGNINDRFYGGRNYGAMLKAVAPVLRAADPAVQIWIGGLLLDEPYTTAAGKGRPELFLQGILEAGAAPYFDVVPYHAYTPYLNQTVDPDNAPASPWYSRGGRVRGKAAFLREIMAAYGVSKPLFLNETALMCPTDNLPYKAYCSPPADAFFQMQAVYLVRSFTRALANDVQGVIWYTINGPGWFNTGLLDAQDTPTQAFRAFKVLSELLQTAEYTGTVDYGQGVEAYAFARYDRRVHVVWAIDDQTLAISVPQSRFIDAVDRDGNALTPIAFGDNYLFLARFEPIYITLKP